MAMVTICKSFDPVRVCRLTGAGSDVEDDWVLEPWNVKVQTFRVHGVLHSCESVEDHRPVTSLDGVEGVVRSVSEASGEHEGTRTAGSSIGGSAASSSSATTTASSGRSGLLCRLLKGISKSLCHSAILLILLGG